MARGHGKAAGTVCSMYEPAFELMVDFLLQNKPLVDAMSTSADDAKGVALEDRYSAYENLKDFRQKDCWREIAYGWGKGRSDGRRYARGYAVQRLQRQLRHLTTRGICTDWDMENCFMQLLSEWCRMNGVPCPLVNEYIAGKTAVLQRHAQSTIDVRTGELISRDAAKSAYLGMVSGGGVLSPDGRSLKVSAKALTSTSDNKWERLADFTDPWDLALHAELQRIGVIFAAAHPDDAAAIGKQRNANGKVMSRVLGRLESELLEIMVAACAEADVAAFVRMFDGAMTMRAGAPEDVGARMEAAVKARTDYTVFIKDKEIPRLDVRALAAQHGVQLVGLDLFDRACAEQDALVAGTAELRDPPTGIVGSLPAPPAPVDMTYLQILPDGRVALAENIFLVDGKFVSCEAGMSLGKSHQMDKLIAYFVERGLSVVVVTQRRTMVTASMGRLADMGFKRYDKTTDNDGTGTGPIDLRTYPLVVCEYESIHRIAGSPALVVLDEFRSDVNTFVSSTNGEQGSMIVRNYHVLEDILRHAQKVLFLDADMSFDGAAHMMQQIMSLRRRKAELERAYAELAERRSRLAMLQREHNSADLIRRDAVTPAPVEMTERELKAAARDERNAHHAAATAVMAGRMPTSFPVQVTCPMQHFRLMETGWSAALADPQHAAHAAAVACAGRMPTSFPVQVTCPPQHFRLMETGWRAALADPQHAAHAAAVECAGRMPTSFPVHVTCPPQPFRLMETGWRAALADPQHAAHAAAVAYRTPTSYPVKVPYPRRWPFLLTEDEYGQALADPEHAAHAAVAAYHMSVAMQCAGERNGMPRYYPVSVPHPPQHFLLTAQEWGEALAHPEHPAHAAAMALSTPTAYPVTVPHLPQHFLLTEQEWGEALADKEHAAHAAATAYLMPTSYPVTVPYPPQHFLLTAREWGAALEDEAHAAHAAAVEYRAAPRRSTEYYPVGAAEVGRLRAEYTALLDQTLDWPAAEPVHRIKVEHKAMRREVTVCTRHKAMWRAREAVERGDRIAVMFGTKKEANKFALVMQKLTPSVGVYTGDSKIDGDVNDVWDDLQVIIFTSVYTTGVDYQGAIDEVYIMPARKCCTPRDMMQGSGRLRNVTSGRIYVGVSEGALHAKPLTREQLDEQQRIQYDSLFRGRLLVRSEIDDAKTHLLYATDPGEISGMQPHEAPAPLLVAQSYVMAERHYAETDWLWMSMFKYHCQLKGYAVHVDDEDVDDDIKKEQIKGEKAAAKQLKGQREQLLNSVDVTRFVLSGDAFRMLQRVARGIGVTVEEWAAFYGSCDLNPSNVKAAAEKAAAARVLRLQHGNITPQDVGFVQRFATQLECHDVLNIAADSKCAVADMVQYYCAGAPAEIARCHPVLRVKYCEELIVKLGPEGAGDFTTHVREPRDVDDDRSIGALLNKMASVNIGRGMLGQSNSKRAHGVLFSQLGYKLSEEGDGPLRLDGTLQILLMQRMTVTSQQWYDARRAGLFMRDEHGAPRDHQPRASMSSDQLDDIRRMYSMLGGARYDRVAADAAAMGARAAGAAAAAAAEAAAEADAEAGAEADVEMEIDAEPAVKRGRMSVTV